MTLSKQIRENFDALSPGLQLAARFVLDRPSEVVTGSMRSVAASSGIAPSNLLRLAQQLGFAGWPALKAQLVGEMGLGNDRYAGRAQTLLRRSKDQRLVAELFDVHRANLLTTEQHSGASLQAVASVLSQAVTVHVAGFRACFPVAYSLAYVYRLFRDSVSLVDATGGGLEMQLRAVKKQDALVAISFAPYSREALQAAQAAKNAGGKLIAMTDSAASPLSLLADQTLLFSTQSPSFFPSITSALAITEALLELLVSQAGTGVVEKVNQAELQLFESGGYLQPPVLR
jgi:DNA-binding MurR/RpiR family transcriptional regulator